MLGLSAAVLFIHAGVRAVSVMLAGKGTDQHQASRLAPGDGLEAFPG